MGQGGKNEVYSMDYYALSSAIVCKGVYEATMKELEAGWITGPICPEQLDGRAVCTRRFGAIQHSTERNGDRVEKIRQIDDFTESLDIFFHRPRNRSQNGLPVQSSGFSHLVRREGCKGFTMHEDIGAG